MHVQKDDLEIRKDKVAANREQNQATKEVALLHILPAGSEYRAEILKHMLVDRREFEKKRVGDHTMATGNGRQFTIIDAEHTQFVHSLMETFDDDYLDECYLV